MDTKIFIDKDNKLFVTTRIEEWERKIQLMIFPDLKFQLIDISDINLLQSAKGVSYDVVPNKDFILVNNLLKSKRVETISIHESTIIDTSVISCIHLILGNKVKFELKSEWLNSVERITFLNLKSFKGNITGDLIGVKHLVLWEDKKSQLNDVLRHFPNLESLYVVRTSLEILDLSENLNLNSLELHDCRRLKDLKLDGNVPANIVIEMCPNLII